MTFAIAEELRACGSALLHEASGRRGWLGPDVRAMWPGAALAGPARTVEARAGDNLGIHRALESIEPGEVLCVGWHGAIGYGGVGEIVAAYALARGCAGLVTAGGVRDVGALEEAGFPVFGSSHALQGTAKRDPGRHQLPVRIGRAIVRPGTWMVGDADGCVAVDAGVLGAVRAAAGHKRAAEVAALSHIERGLSSSVALGLMEER